jgi:DNA-binding MarR family transcriptional regulator
MDQVQAQFPDTDSDRGSDSAWFEVLSLMVASETYVAQLRGSLGLSANEMNALLALHVDGPCAISDLASRIRLTRPALTTMVERMLKQGWITRGTHDTDRRKVIISTTRRFDEELLARSTSWRHRLRNLASASDHWQSLPLLLDDVAQIAIRSASELRAEQVAVTRPAP